jgi:hypothetical protein
MTGAMAAIDDGAWTAIKHANAIFDEDQRRWISDAAQAAPSGLPGPRRHRCKTTLLDRLAAAVPIWARVGTRTRCSNSMRRRARAELETWQGWTVSAVRSLLPDGVTPYRSADVYCLAERTPREP